MSYFSGKTLFQPIFPSGLTVLNMQNISRQLRSQSQIIKRQVKTACKVPPSTQPKPNTIPTAGQPTHFTHPHKILKGEVVPGIRLEELRMRRNRLLDSMKSFCSFTNLHNKTLFAIIPSSYKKYMTEKIPYVFRQNSDFLYLTGCLEPDSILLLISKENNYESVIFLRGKDPTAELWDGPRTGVDQAVELFGVDKSLPTHDFESFIQHFIKENRDCMLWYDYMSDTHPSVHKVMQQFLSNSWNKIWESPKPLIHRLRLYKSPAEQELMKKSCQIASQSIKNAMKNSKPYDSEATIQARVDFECRIRGAEHLAYPPVVASGNRANIIHYISNNQVVEEGDLVLMDAGCEYHGYCSDITRTWPVSGKFSSAQRALYEAVFSVQTDLIQMCCKFPTLNQLYETMGRLLGIRLKDLGIISNKVKQEDMNRVVSLFCPHHVSHYLGMDVHDTATIPRHIPLEPGMIFTIEPGAYVSRENKFANPEFHGLGVRIEDDILMTSSGPFVLTSSCPKHPEDIEKLYAE